MEDSTHCLPPVVGARTAASCGETGRKLASAWRFHPGGRQDRFYFCPGVRLPGPDLTGATILRQNFACERAATRDRNTCPSKQVSTSGIPDSWFGVARRILRSVIMEKSR
jgi:hypothetical protein